MKGLPIALIMDNVDPESGPAKAPAPLGTLKKVMKNLTGAPVLAGKTNMFVATVGDVLALHGNPVNPQLPGYNTTCDTGKSTITKAKASTTVFVNGRNVAMLGTVCSCTHTLFGPGAPTVLVGR